MKPVAFELDRATLEEDIAWGCALWGVGEGSLAVVAVGTKAQSSIFISLMSHIG